MQSITKRLATLLLLVVAMLMPQLANAAGTQPSGAGTSSSPSQIATAANLLWFADQVNNVHNTSICAKLTADITLSGSTDEYVIGTKDYGFKGEFDGAGHTISDVNVTTTKTGNNGYQYAGGLFGCIKASTSETAVVKNLTVAGSVNVTGLTTVYYIGGVIGIAYGNVNISNVTSRVNLTTTSNDKDAHCGGIVASVEWFENGKYDGNLTVSNCVNYGTLNVSCGEICGGVVGYIRNGSITDCLNVGNITNSEDGYTAGILGYVNSTGCTLSRCLNLGTITNTKKAANAYAVYYKKDNIGTVSNLYYKSGTGGTALTATEVSAESIKDGSVAYLLSSGTWGQSLGNNSVNDAYPYPNKTAYKVYQSGSNYYNNITSNIPTGDFTTTIETAAQYISNQTRIGDTKSFTVTANAGKYITTVKHNGTTLTASNVSNNKKTYSYTVGLSNTFAITTAAIACTTTLNQSTTTLNLADNYVGSTETFTVTPKAGNYVTNVIINGETVAGTAVFGKTDGTNSYSFTVKESNTLTVNTEAIVCTTTLGESTSTLNIKDNYVGSTETFTATPKAGYYITGATINDVTVNGTAVSGKTDGTRSFSFTVKESNAVTINTAAIAYTRPTSTDFTTNLPDNLSDKQIGSIVEFTVTPKEGKGILEVTHNYNSLSPSASDTDGTGHYSFTVTEKNNIIVAMTPDKVGNAYEITNTAQLYWFAEQVNNGNTDINAVLTADIVVNEHVLDADGNLNGESAGFRVWTPIGIDTDGQKYEGTFDGQGHTISGLYIDDEKKSVVGLFRATDTNSVIKNVGIIDSYFRAYQHVAGISGSNGGIIDNCYSGATCAVSNVGVGGIVSWNGGTISNCHNMGFVYGLNNVGGVCNNNSTSGIISNCYNVGTISSSLGNKTGGVCGYSNGIITNCYNRGIVSGNIAVGGVCGHSFDSSLSNCYNIGAVSGTNNVGGVCGYAEKVSITHCYNTGAVNGEQYVGGLCGIASYGSLSNCYYLSDPNIQGIGYGSGEAIAKTAEQFASGEVAWLLNGSEAGENPAWRQTIGEDEYPVLDAKQGIVIHTTPTSLNSIVRPTAGTLVGAADVYNFAGIDGKKVYGIPHTGTLAAEHPYVFTTNCEYVSFVPSDEDVTDNTETCGLTGVLDPAGKKVYGKDNTAGEDVSIVFTADALKYANPKGNTVKYGKCYINAEECFITNEPVGASKIASAFEDGVAGLENVSIDSVEGETYNLQGIPVGDNYKGFIIQNGRKILRR